MFCLIVSEQGFNVSLPQVMEKSTSVVLSSGKVLSLFHHFASKPIDDSYLISSEAGFSMFEGISASHSPQKIQELLRETNNSEIAKIHGQYACMHWDNAAQELRVYSSVNNNMRVYYYHQGETIIVASSIKLIVGVLKQNGITCHPDELGSRMLLTFGYMLRNNTNIAEIRLLGAGHYLCYQNGQFERKQYYRFNTNPLYYTYKGALNDLNDLFVNAVKLAVERDGQQRHFSFISGGVDSRLVLWTLHNMKLKNVDCLNYSQPGYLDNVIGTQISKTLGYKCSFFSLEGGEFLKNIDRGLGYNEGQIVLHGAAHLHTAIQTMPLEKYGILHSGQIGDISKGSFMTAGRRNKLNFSVDPRSKRLLPTILPELEKYASDYSTHEHFVLESLGFNCNTNGDLASSEFTYSLAPFMDPTFMQYELNIAPELRVGARMHLYWIRKCFPEAAKFKWEKINCRVNVPYWQTRLSYNVWRGTDKIIRKITKRPNQLSMNPFEYWWVSNPSLREFFKPRFRIPEALLPVISKELAEDINMMFNLGSFGEKLQAYTAVRSLEYLLLED